VLGSKDRRRGPYGEHMQRRHFIKFLGATAVTWPLKAYAQKSPKIPTIGILWHAGSEKEEAVFLGAVRQGFKDLGYVEGQNIKLINTFAAEQYERFDANAAELVAFPVDVLVAVSTPAALAAQGATKTIPIVFVGSIDPVQMKLADSIARPGGNITGLTNLATDLTAKRLEVLKEVLPNALRVGLLANSSNPANARRFIAESQGAAAKLNLTVQLVEVRAPDELDRAFSMIEGQVDAMFVPNDGMFYNERRRIAELALAHRVPLMVAYKEAVQFGALISYGPSTTKIYGRVPYYVDKILKGAKPADLPIELPTLFELFINAKTAKLLGITIPPTLLSRADEVIE
jgi:putative tryptophan/tyrosine transport system substrate-binding protein